MSKASDKYGLINIFDVRNELDRLVVIQSHLPQDLAQLSKTRETQLRKTIRELREITEFDIDASVTDEP